MIGGVGDILRNYRSNMQMHSRAPSTAAVALWPASIAVQVKMAVTGEQY